MEVEQAKGKNWVATMMLCWALGMFGAHRFYTGKTNSAWVMVALAIICAPVSMIWQIVDGFTIALGKYKHADGSELYERINWLGYVYIAVIILGILVTLAYAWFVIALIGAAFASAGTGAY